ncbi:MAG: hypothetical protein ACRDYD_07665 [Acidimicrobiales bacterium]
MARPSIRSTKRGRRGLLAALALVGGLAVVAARPQAASATVPEPGYWMATAAGAVMAYGNVPVLGSVTGPLASPIVGMAAVPDGKGYWLVAADGGVFAFGDAAFHGSMGGHPLNRPIVGMTSTPDGNGYWLVASDGGIFAFGDAAFHGSMGGHPLNRPIVGIAADPATGGYWMVASDGGIFAVDAPFLGSMGSHYRFEPIVGMSASPGGRGYRLVASDGGIFDYGDAAFYGSTGGHRLNRPVVGTATTPDGNGYWLVASDGGIFAYGDAGFRGSAGSQHLTDPVVAMADPSSQVGVVHYASGSSGYDISWPQCPSNLPPAAPGTIATVGLNDGVAFSTNPCLATEAAWAGLNLNLYLNLNTPSWYKPSEGDSGPAGTCSASDLSCRSYNYGWNAATASMATAHSLGIAAPTYWLDIELPPGNSSYPDYWSTDLAANSRVIQGTIDALSGQGITVGIYSTSTQWSEITGTYAPGVPNWVAGAGPLTQAQQWCAPGASTPSGQPVAFGGGKVWMIQWGYWGVATPRWDPDYAC